MGEKTDYNLFKKHVLKHGDRIERIENIAGVGTPDVNYCIDGVEGWIELKSPIEPLRFNSKLFADNHKLNLSQRNWFLRQRNAGGRAYILIATDKRWMLIDGKYADIINKLTVGQLHNVAEWRDIKPIFKSQWEALRMVLTNGSTD